MELEKFTLRNEAGLEVIFCTLGASIYGIRFHDEWMTLTPKEDKDYSLLGIYHGKTVGRAANRLKGNRLEIDGKTYALEDNQLGNVLHGGLHPISARVFAYKTEETGDEFIVSFHTLSPDGESGFPGNLELNVTYRLKKKEATLCIEFEAKTDKATLCNLTNHSYFSLGEKNLNNLSLRIPASTYIKAREEDLVLVSLSPVNEALDFRKEKPVMKDIAKVDFGMAHGYDHGYLFDEGEHAVTLSSPRYRLTIESDFFGAQIYADNYEDDIAYFGTEDPSRRGLAIEPQDNTLNREVLRPGDIYRHHIAYHFEKAGERE